MSAVEAVKLALLTLGGVVVLSSLAVCAAYALALFAGWRRTR